MVRRTADCSSRSDAAVTYLYLVGLAAALLTHPDVLARGAQGKKAQGNLFARSSCRTLQETLRQDVLEQHLRRILTALTARKAKQILRTWAQLKVTQPRKPVTLSTADRGAKPSGSDALVASKEKATEG